MSVQARRARLYELIVICALVGVGLGVRLHIRDGWTFVGGDSQGYLQLARNLAEHGTYAIAPNQPPHYSRMPLYPLFLAAVGNPRRTSRLDVTGVQVVLDLLAGLALYLIARRLAGRVAAALALALAMVCPFTAYFPAAIMSETLAAAITTLAICALIAGRRRPRLRFFVAGVLTGLGVLARADGLLVAFAFLPALLLRDGDATPLRERARWAALALAGFVLVYAPWPLRDWVKTGAAHPLGGFVTWHHGPLEHAEGYHHWLSTWARDGAPTRLGYCFYERSCVQDIASYPSEAFSSPAEHDEVAALIAARATTGVDEAMSERFDALAADHRRRRPFYVNVSLPLRRATNLWVNRHEDLIEDERYRPWRAVYDPVLHNGVAISKWMTLAILAGAALLLARRRTRRIAAVLLAALVGRTLVLAYSYYVEPRYLVEVIPLGLVLIAGGLVELTRWRRAVPPPVD